MTYNPLLLTDFYKVGHKFQYPEGTQLVYSNLTARSSRLPDINEVVLFGTQYAVKKFLIDDFNKNFFARPLAVVLDEYKRFTEPCIGTLPSIDHIKDLHYLGYLPLCIKALPEGSRVPLRIPLLTIHNTNEAFAWLTNYIETAFSNLIWQPITSATIADQYRKIINRGFKESGLDPQVAGYMGHDFSFRGMGGLDSAIASGMAHLTSFRGTDTIPANQALAYYYSAMPEDYGRSVPATEHSVMCAGGESNEQETFRRLIEDVYPTGIVSIVSDTWDLFNGVIRKYLPALKQKIMARSGKVVIRPDSGDPVNIVCGNPSSADILENKGVVECLWDIFGGTLTSTGHKQLHPHIGVIYGDSITRERADRIIARLLAKGFAADSCVFGIGSYTYQYVTRDTFGFAIKSTAVKINGTYMPIFKKPKTDNGLKNSARGFLRVDKTANGYVLTDNLPDLNATANDAMKVVFLNGEPRNKSTIRDIRTLLAQP